MAVGQIHKVERAAPGHATGRPVRTLTFRLAVPALCVGILEACSGASPEANGNVTVLVAPGRALAAEPKPPANVAPQIAAPSRQDRDLGPPRKDFADPPLPKELQENASGLAPLPQRPAGNNSGSPPSA